MKNLEKLICPNCGKVLIPINNKIEQTFSFETCKRRCMDCGIGFSNARNNPTIIYKDYCDNIPELLRLDLEFVLKNTVNITNRKNKKDKFAFSTSEDALTWSFFKYFVSNRYFTELLKLLNIESNESIYEIYLWGVNITSNIVNTELYIELINTSDYFQEDGESRTEPDVIIKLNNKLIFIEVKYNSSNNVIKDQRKFSKYKIPDVNFERIVESGHYELYRNWAFATKMSKGNNFELINLAPQKVFTDKRQDKLRKFEESLNSNNGKFIKLSWEEVINKMNNSNYHSWFIEYLNRKIKRVPQISQI